MYELNYHHANALIKQLPVKSYKKSGRRNSSYGTTFPQSRLEHLSASQKGHPCKTIYVRTPEIKEKISKTLKDGYKTGRIKQNPALQSQAWADGKYKDAKMGRGIQGYFHSTKMDDDMYFRSLLELDYMLIIENDEAIIEYEFEPFQIQLGNGRHYTPDVIINKNLVVELKPRGFERYTDYDRFLLEMDGLGKYCAENDLEYTVIYDDEIGFNSKEFKRYIKNNPDIIQQYDIRFKKEI